MNKNFKLIAFDLDGTLISPGDVLSEKNAVALEELYKKGVKLVPTTGRSLYEMPTSVLEFPYFEYYITSGGACTYNAETLEMIESRLIPPERSKKLFDILFDYDTVTMTHFEGEGLVDADLVSEEYYNKCRVNESFKKFIPEKDRAIPNFNEACMKMEGVELTCSFIGSDEEMAGFKERVREAGGFSIASSAKDNVEVTDANADKGKAILSLASSLGISREEIIGVGDSRNDIALIRAAGLGIAMGNATEELKREADAVGCNNSEHIADFILKNYFN